MFHLHILVFHQQLLIKMYREQVETHPEIITLLYKLLSWTYIFIHSLDFKISKIFDTF